ncbi:hypothetical protein POTOM_012658 [Populus tomentosa]|uniref:Uncharacterized protein n=1 Tax=Populus tomentosa TaxID=118781 RepID=A0A8X8DBC3_POPTO|nr:hypothetical protein POTOM_012658 [Populus tomentosa]
MQPSALPIQILRVGQLAILSVPGGTFMFMEMKHCIWGEGILDSSVCVKLSMNSMKLSPEPLQAFTKKGELMIVTPYRMKLLIVQSLLTVTAGAVEAAPPPFRVVKMGRKSRLD